MSFCKGWWKKKDHYNNPGSFNTNWKNKYVSFLQIPSILHKEKGRYLLKKEHGYSKYSKILVRRKYLRRWGTADCAIRLVNFLLIHTWFWNIMLNPDPISKEVVIRDGLWFCAQRSKSLLKGQHSGLRFLRLLYRSLFCHTVNLVFKSNLNYLHQFFLLKKKNKQTKRKAPYYGSCLLLS